MACEHMASLAFLLLLFDSAISSRFWGRGSQPSKNHSQLRLINRQFCLLILFRDYFCDLCRNFLRLLSRFSSLAGAQQVAALLSCVGNRKPACDLHSWAADHFISWLAKLPDRSRVYVLLPQRSTH